MNEHRLEGPGPSSAQTYTAKESLGDELPPVGGPCCGQTLCRLAGGEAPTFAVKKLVSGQYGVFYGRAPLVLEVDEERATELFFEFRECVL